MFVSNHPYEGGLPHVSDMAFVAPVFADGEIVAFSGSIAHKADVGGMVPGSTSANATEMYHEGLLVPPIKIWDDGKPLPDIERIILTNSRQPALVRGDMHAQIAVTQMGAARVKELCARFGVGDRHRRVRGDPQGRGRRTARRHRQAAGRHCVGARACSTSDGITLDQPIKLAVNVTIKDGVASFDFSGSDPQARGPGQPAALDGRGLRVLFADRLPRSEPALQRRHARRGAARASRRAPSSMPSRPRRSRTTRWSTSSWST